MTGSGIVKAGDRRGRSLMGEFPIYIHSSEALFTSIYLLPLLFLSSDHLKDCAMPRLWRVRSRARVHNRGSNFSEASGDAEVEPTPQTTAPFNWGDQYLSETPPAIDAYIVIMEIDLLREFESIMGCPLIPNPFWSARILLSRDIQAKIQTAQGIHEAMETIHYGQQESVAGF